VSRWSRVILWATLLGIPLSVAVDLSLGTSADRLHLLRLSLLGLGWAGLLYGAYRMRLSTSRAAGVAQQPAMAADPAPLRSESPPETEPQSWKRQVAELSERLHVLKECAGDGFWDWDLDTNEVDYSPRWKSVLGLAEHEVGSHCDEWLSRIHPEDRERVDAELSAHRMGILVPYRSEHRLRVKDGSYRSVLVQGSSLRDENGRPTRMVGWLSDVTELKRVQEQLARVTSEAQAVFRAFPDLYFRLDAHGTILDHHATRLSDLFSLPEPFRGKNLREVFPSPAAEQMQGAVDQVVKGQSLVAVEYSLPGPYGDQWFETRLVPLPNAQVFAIIRDITARQRAEEGLLAAARARQQASAAARDAERRRLARELHDGVLQDLGAVKLRLEGELLRTKAEALQAPIEDLIRTIADLRRLVDDIRPPDLSRASLNEAIAAHARLLTHAKGIALDLDVPPGVGVPEWATRDAYRIAQEAIANAIRHGSPSRLSVRLYREERSTVLEIDDDGVGFDLRTATLGGGVRGIQERAAALGADLEITTSPGEGTILRLVIPAEQTKE
jgi:PAS domain S-box-containing protein